MKTTATLDSGCVAQWLGRREAFGMISGRCSAATVECLRIIRDEKLYVDRARNWDDFCSDHLGSSRRAIDNHIRHLKEFGPAFFQVAQLTGITPEAYRAIAPQVNPQGLTLDGEVIGLVAENRRKLADAVATLRSRAPAQPAPAALNFAKALKRCESVSLWLESLTRRLDPDQQYDLLIVLRRLGAAATRVGVEFQR